SRSKNYEPLSTLSFPSRSPKVVITLRHLARANVEPGMLHSPTARNGMAWELTVDMCPDARENQRLKNIDRLARAAGSDEVPVERRPRECGMQWPYGC